MSEMDDVLARAGLVAASELVAEEQEDPSLAIVDGRYMNWPLAADQSYAHPSHETADIRRHKQYDKPRSFYVQGREARGWVPWVGVRPIFEETEPQAWVQDLASDFAPDIVGKKGGG